MLQTSFSTIGKPRRTVRLGVEILEGRDLPSTLSVVSYPAPQAVWPPPPPNVQVSVLAPSSSKVVHTAHVGEEIPQFPSASTHLVVPFDHHDPIGEEIPQ